MLNAFCVVGVCLRGKFDAAPNGIDFILLRTIQFQGLEKALQFCLLLLMLQVEYGLLEPSAILAIRCKRELRGKVVLLSLADIGKQTRLTFNFCYLCGLARLLATKGSNLRLLSDQLIAL